MFPGAARWSPVGYRAELRDLTSHWLVRDSAPDQGLVSGRTREDYGSSLGRTWPLYVCTFGFDFLTPCSGWDSAPDLGRGRYWSRLPGLTSSSLPMTLLTSGTALVHYLELARARTGGYKGPNPVMGRGYYQIWPPAFGISSGFGSRADAEPDWSRPSGFDPGSL